MAGAGADGKPVGGAIVTVVHVESGSTSTATTDTDGRYALRGLRPGGPYRVTVTRGGETERRDGVFLTLAETTAMDLRLAPAAQTIVVTGRGISQTFNSSNIGAGTQIGSREINMLASIQRSLQDLARTAPRLSQTDKERGEISALGQNSSFNSVTIDGVTTSDTFGLENNNLPTLKQPISIDAIPSVQVNVSNHDVTQQGYTGTNINAVTKSGTNGAQEIQTPSSSRQAPEQTRQRRLIRGLAGLAHPSAARQDTARLSPTRRAPLARSRARVHTGPEAA